MPNPNREVMLANQKTRSLEEKLGFVPLVNL